MLGWEQTASSRLRKRGGRVSNSSGQNGGSSVVKTRNSVDVSEEMSGGSEWLVTETQLSGGERMQASGLLSRTEAMQQRVVQAVSGTETAAATTMEEGVQISGREVRQTGVGEAVMGDRDGDPESGRQLVSSATEPRETEAGAMRDGGQLASASPAVTATTAVRPASVDGGGAAAPKSLMKRYEKDLTVHVSVLSEEEMETFELMRNVRQLCGGLMGCRKLGFNRYEVTLSTLAGKTRIMDGFQIGSAVIDVTDICNSEVMVSFLKLPVYISDENILAKLRLWGVEAVSPIKRRVWPGTNVADGTRIVRVRFPGTVKSLPYSAKFDTVQGAEYFRVLHNHQVKVCRLCMSPDHIMKDCPQFTCRRCNEQGHYVRDCVLGESRCGVCLNNRARCICQVSESENTDDDGTLDSRTDHVPARSDAAGLLAGEGDAMECSLQVADSGETELDGGKVVDEESSASGGVLGPTNVDDDKPGSQAPEVRSGQGGPDGMLVNSSVLSQAVGTPELHNKMMADTEAPTMSEPPAQAPVLLHQRPDALDYGRDKPVAPLVVDMEENMLFDLGDFQPAKHKWSAPLSSGKATAKSEKKKRVSRIASKPYVS